MIANSRQDQLITNPLTTLSFPNSLDDFSKITALHGGTNSTYLIQNPHTKQSFVIKYGAHNDAIKIEILCNKLYQILGVPVPGNHFYKTIPEAIAQKINVKHSQGRIFQISEYIEPDNEDLDIIISTAKKHFAVHALLGNIDIKKNNFIVHQNQAFLIDVGSNFIFRSLGETRHESISWVSEIQSLIDPKSNKQSYHWFFSLTKEDISDQVKKIIAHKKEIETSLWQLAYELDLSADLSDIFLQGLSDRLDDLICRFCPLEQTFAKRDKKARPKHTAAGILIYTFLNNKVHIFLAKRNRHEWYDNFGGESTALDIYLYNTARREAEEESSKIFNLTKRQLFNLPSHDLITTRENGDTFIYRMYLANIEHKEIDFNQLKDSEHTKYIWVPVADIIDSLNQQTIQVKVSASETISLYPPLYNTLQSDVMKKHLVHLNKGKVLLKQHTQSVFHSHSIPKAGYHESKRPLTSPTHMRDEISHHLLCYQYLMKELNAINKLKNKKEIISSPPSYINSLSQSEWHMKVILGKIYQENNLKENLRNFFLNKYNLSKMTSNQLEILIIHCSQLIEREKSLGKEYIYFYHACDNKVSFIYTIYTKLYQSLENSHHWPVFRASQAYFKKFSNILEFIAYYSNNGKKKINNYGDDDFHNCALSANLFLLGNHEVNTSCSIYYFLENLTKGNIDLLALLQDILRPFSIPDNEINLLIQYFNQHCQSQGGSIYQIAIPKDEVSQLAYPAISNGAIAHYKNCNELVPILKELKKDITQDEEAIELVKILQSRLFLPPNRRINAKQIPWKNTHNEIDDAKLDAIIQHILHTLLSFFNELNGNTLDGSLLLFKLLPTIYANNFLPMLEINNSLLAKAIIGKNVTLVDRLLDKYPNMKLEKISYPQTFFNEYHVRPSIEMKEEMLPIVMIIKFSNFSPDFMLKHFGNQWWINQAPPLTTLKDMIAVLRKIPSADKINYYHYLRESHLFLRNWEMISNDFVHLLMELPDDNIKLSLAEQHKIFGVYTLIDILKCLSENDRFTFALKHTHLIKPTMCNGLDDVLQTLLIHDRYPFIQKCEKQTINSYNLKSILNTLPINEYQNFIKEFVYLIDSTYILSEVIIYIPDDEKLFFILNNNFPIHSGLEVITIAKLLLPTDRSSFALHFLEKFSSDKNDLLSIVELLPEDEKFSFIINYVDKLASYSSTWNSFNYFCFIALYSFPSNLKISLTHYYSDKLTDEHFFRIFENYILFESRSQLIENNPQRIKGINDLLFCLQLVPNKLSLAIFHHDKIDSLKDLKHVLEKLEMTERTFIAEKYRYKIKDGIDLCRILPMLPDEDRANYAMKFATLLDTYLFSRVLSYISLEYHSEMTQKFNLKKNDNYYSLNLFSHQPYNHDNPSHHRTNHHVENDSNHFYF